MTLNTKPGKCKPPSKHSLINAFTLHFQKAIDFLLQNSQLTFFSSYSISIPSSENLKTANMTSRIPTSTSITESSVIAAPLAQVWHLVKLQDFHHFWSKLDKSFHVKGLSPETDIVKWSFKDGTEQEVKQEEHSVRRMPSCTLSYLPCSVCRLADIDLLCRALIISSPTQSFPPHQLLRTPASSPPFDAML